MTQLRERDSRAMFDFLAEAEAVDGPEPFPEPLVESLRQLIGCDLAEFDEMDRAERRCGWTTATLSEPEPVNLTISHISPTVCIQLPVIEASWPVKYLR